MSVLIIGVTGYLRDLDNGTPQDEVFSHPYKYGTKVNTERFQVKIGNPRPASDKSISGLAKDEVALSVPVEVKATDGEIGFPRGGVCLYDGEKLWLPQDDPFDQGGRSPSYSDLKLIDKPRSYPDEIVNENYIYVVPRRELSNLEVWIVPDGLTTLDPEAKEELASNHKPAVIFRCMQ